MAKEPSGVVWVERFPTSRLTDALAEGFRQNCEAFLSALDDAGADVTINATLRPPERAYLMHWSFLISTGEVEPSDVPPHDGVAIEWVHRTPNGFPDLAASRAAAAAMVEGYDIAHRPSLASLHIFGKAIDRVGRVGRRADHQTGERRQQGDQFAAAERPQPRALGGGRDL
jgi:hypothetical protein